MEEEIKPDTIEDNTQDYIEEMERLKKETVPIDAYSKLKEENKKLIKALSTSKGTEETITAPKYTTKDIKELANKLQSTDEPNPQFMSDLLTLRDMIQEVEGKDIALTDSPFVEVTDKNIEDTNRIIDIYKECVTNSEGNPSRFQSDYTGRIVENVPVFKKR